ncbi:autophagy-related protein 2 homolog B-like isoform X2 [Chiloscyllium plagiosum]|uniref:autophagy-related protein 2 homolog B-like isoform X2 n=1 Tax=Chiloscyllium plagiosum TaxID=36176 RepID=UPI001CB836C6|nr:autophagy-related protein 2 homolog B-like isoform X2 [Chiloscyllium plagiosum]
MPWPFSESIKKRACRYLLHRYLDHFLEEKLSLEQLSVDLYQGTGSLAQVPLDKSSLNEILESLDAPLEIIEGFIQNISVSIPWASLLQENCAVEIRGLEMVFRPKPRIVSGSEPMYWSSFMTDSMQLAKECLSQRLTDDQADGPQPFEGLEKFAETIETVLRRVKLTFLETVLRIEHVPENSKTGIALEVRIQRIEYRDESANESPDINIHHPTAFAQKNLQLCGITLSWHEFPESAKTSPRTSPMQEMEPKLSPSWNPKIVSEPHPQFTRKASDAVLFDPVQIGSCEGEVVLKLTLNQNEALPVAKLDVEGQIESVNFFLSPRQVHLLLDMLSTILLPGCAEATTVPSKSRRNRPMQQEDQYLIQMELNRYMQKEKGSPGISAEQSYYETETVRTTSSREDDVFFSMADMEMSNSMASLPPLGEPTIDMELSLSSTHANSTGSSPQSTPGFSTSWDDYLDHSGQGGRMVRESAFNSKELPITQRPLRPSSLHSKSHSNDESRPQIVIRLIVDSLSISVLHIDPLPPPESPLHLDPLSRMASHFFEQLKTLDLPSFLTGDFNTLRPKFAAACPHDHLRFFATGIKLSYEQRRGTSSRSLNTDVSINWMELLECLFPTDSLTVIPQYTELITFQSESETGAHPTPLVQLHYKHIDRRGVQGSQGRLTAVPQKADLQIELGLVQSELDISIVDRLNSLLQPQKLATAEMMASHMYTSFNKHVSLQRAFTEVFRDDSASPANQRTSVQLTTALFKLAIRFPIPDLRSDQERGPWFKKSLQKEILHLEFSEAEFKTELFGSLSHEQLKLELTFKELLGKFQEDPATPPFTFFKVSYGADGDMSTSDSGKFDWPRVVLKVNPTVVHSILERITTEEEEPGSHLLEDEEGGSHSLKDVCDLGKQEPSPFSSRRVMYENEEMVMPGDQFEMGQFQDKTISTSHYVLELMLPNVNLTLPNKAFYEKVYNRINNDLLLWEPAAPSPVETVENITYGVGLSVASQLINAFNKENLPQLKSTLLLQDDDESGSDEETLQFCPSTDPAHRSRRKKKVEQPNKNCQSFLSILLNVSHGLVSIYTDTKSEDGTLLAGKHGEFWLEIENGSLFTVGKYQGCDGQHYFCLQTSKVFLCHQGVVEDVCAPGDIKLPSKSLPPWVEPTIYKSEEGALTKQAAAPVGVGVESPNMLSIAVKVHHNRNESNMKEILVAVGLRGATLQHRNVPPGQSWYEQFVDFLNIADEPVLGYAHPANETTFHLHLWSCALDYRPQYLPVRALVTVETFTISSNIVLDKYCSTLRIIIDDAALYLSEKCHLSAVNLKKDYVRVLDMGLLEFQITASKQTAEAERPRFELRCASDVIHIRTCSDSCAALMNLIQYVASYGDLHPPCKFQAAAGTAAQRSRAGSGDSAPCRTSGLAEAEQKLLRDLMIDAMEEMDIAPSSPPTTQASQHSNGIYDDLIHEREPARSDLFLFPDESGSSSQEHSPSSTMIFPEHHAVYPTFPSEQPESEDFCILEAPKMAIMRETEPVVRMLNSGPILIKDDYFSQPVKKLDTSKSPLHLPVPEIRYVVKEISVVWHLYGGRDFGTALSARSPVKSITPKSASSSCQGSPSQSSARHGRSARRIQGGPGRNHDVLMEIQFSKVKFQHEVYPQTDFHEDPSSAERPISRQVFIVQDLEIRDRLATSQMNKFLYLYSSKEFPRKAHSNMLTIKALHVSPDSTQMPRECCLRITLMPLRLNIDQDALFFLKDYFTSLATEVELLIPPDPIQEVRKTPGTDTSSSLSKNGTTAADHGPIITLPGHSKHRPDPLTAASRVPVSEPEAVSVPFRDQPIFFREFRFTSEVPIRLDYHGKHMSMDQGTLAGILIGLAQLNCSELKLKRLCYRHGLLGVDKLISYALNEWLTDIKKNQLPGILGGVGPMHSLVQLVQGLKDLVWLPIEQYRRDGRIVRGLQRGAASFGTSTAMAALELTNRLVQTIQAAAETAYDMVSPGTTTPGLMRTKRISQHRLAHQPVDLREGVAKAYDVVKEGFTDTAHMIYETAAREHEQRGMTGAVGGVLRQIPPAVVKPLIVATEATSNVLGGMRNQIQPDARQEESQKWRLSDQ